MTPNKRATISRGSTAYARKRAVTACQVCRARRTRCDQKKPRCSFCETTGAQCVTEPGAQSSFDPASLAILARLESVENKLDALRGSTPRPSPPPTAESSTPQPFPSHQLVSSLLPQNLDQLLQWSVFERIRPTSTSQPHALAGFQPPHQPPSQPAALLGDELDPSACSHYLNDFFAHVHPKNPVLDELTARRVVRRVCLDGPGWDPESCLALLICANGAVAHPLTTQASTGEEMRRSTSRVLFQAAQKRLGIVLDVAGVVQAQCLFLAGVYLMSSLRPFDAWRLFQHALAMCQGFSSGDHPDPAAESIYWTCWKSEREVRWELGLPDFRDISLDAPQLFPSLPSPNQEEDMLRAWYFYLSEISLWRLEMDARVEIMRSLSEPAHENGLLEQLAGIADSTFEQITLWEQSLPSVVSIASPSPADPAVEDDVLRFVLRGRTTYINELISWPFVACVIAGRPITRRARNWALRGLQSHLRRLSHNEPGFYYRHHGTWLMVRSSTRSLCLLLAVAQDPSAHDLLPEGWKEMALRTMDMLRFWQHEIEGMECLVMQLDQWLSLY
ncbi:uncharacterized protein N7482_010169 [Penicillium canariense]|uniref:Zn(2)-C6 fungal-type domain-containing protein n=1 Tax=Penicillium canariense TaxID=189055 RepID=A0A9W9HKA7_9EURO|nr:uncharacterized protein N7482_010169 [Penicillium canariense]KAJ5150917.1 hypothetical protein N7482_010169 [Penicillium canariense]